MIHSTLLYATCLILGVLAALAVLVLWVRDLLAQRKRKRIGFYGSPFLPDERGRTSAPPRQNIRA
jgi:hypothetical protein